MKLGREKSGWREGEGKGETGNGGGGGGGAEGGERGPVGRGSERAGA